MIKKNVLMQAVLASTLFLSQTGFADQFSTVVIGPVFTSTTSDNIIEVTPTGQIKGVFAVGFTDGAVIDTNSGQVIIDPNNAFGNQAITSVQAFARSVLVTAPNGKITIGGQGSGISASGAVAFAINSTASGTSIDNSGIIQSSGGIAIQLSADVGSTIINNPTGVIQSFLFSQPALNTSGAGPGLTLTNSGLITSNSSTIILDAPFISVTNNNGGLISSTPTSAADTVVITVGPSVNTGNIINNLGGTISLADPQVDMFAIRILGNTSGNIINAGLIQTEADNIFGIHATGHTIRVDGNMTSSGPGVFNIDNSGTIEGINLHGGSSVIFLSPITLSGGIRNNGNILNTITQPFLGVTFALNLSAGNATLYQQDGLIQGNVLLASGDSNNLPGIQNVLVMTGGTINGNVTASNANSNLLTLSGGTITGTTTLGNAGDIVNLSGTSLQTLNGGTGNDIFNVSGGNFTSLNGKAGADTLNVLATFTLNAPVAAVETINVKNPGTVLTVNQTITGMTTQLTTDTGTSIIFNSNIPALGGGAIQNNGTLQVNNGFTVTDTGGALTSNGIIRLLPQSILQVGSFTQNAGSSYIVPIQNVTTGQLQTSTTATLQSNSTIVPELIGNSFIPSGTTFDIIKAAPLGVTDNSTLVQPFLSAVFFFTKSGPSGVTCGANTCVRLTANRNPLSVVGTTEVASAIGATLDSIETNFPAIDPDLLNLIMQLDLLTSAQAVTNALESLAPPYHYGLIAASHAGMDNVFNGIEDRIADLQIYRKRKPIRAVMPPATIKGVNSGDMTGNMGAWVRGMGSELNQGSKDEARGYRADSAGIAVGGDWSFNDFIMFGLAGSYTGASVADKNVNAKDVSIQSWQGTAYSCIDFNDLFYINGLAAIATNGYHTNHIINVNLLQTAAQADFDGTQVGAQMNLGFNMVNNDAYYISPFVRLHYMHLNLQDYTEYGANTIGLAVTHPNNNEFYSGLGVRVSSAFDKWGIQWVPELTSMIAYEYNRDSDQTVSSFLGGGPAFFINGLEPSPTLVDIGFRLNANFCDNSSIAFKYDVQVRDHFAMQSVYLQYFIYLRY